MLQKFNPAVSIDIRVSPALRTLVLVCYSLSAIACLTLSLHVLIRSLLCFLSISYGLYLAFYCHGPRNLSRIKRIEYTDRLGWRLNFVDGSHVYTSLRFPVFVTPFLVIIRFGSGLVPKYTAVIPADAAESRTFRHLRVRLLQLANGSRNRTQVSGT